MISKEMAHTIARGSGWLSEQPAQFQDDLLSRCHLRRFRERESIAHIDDPASGVFCVVSGAVRIEFPVPSGDFKIVTIKQPVIWFGQASSLARRGWPATVTAASPISVLHLTTPDFEELIENKSYCRAFTQLSLDQYKAAVQMLSYQLINNCEQRVALRLATFGRNTEQGMPASVPITQSDLAEMCGLSRPTVQQILSIFERRGLIRTGYRRIEIIDAAGLEAHGKNDPSGFTPEPTG